MSSFFPSGPHRTPEWVRINRDLRIRGLAYGTPAGVGLHCLHFAPVDTVARAMIAYAGNLSAPFRHRRETGMMAEGASVMQRYFRSDLWQETDSDARTAWFQKRTIDR